MPQSAGNLWRYLSLAIGVQIIVGLLLVGHSLLQNDDTSDSPLKKWMRSPATDIVPGQIIARNTPRSLSSLSTDVKKHDITKKSQSNMPSVKHDSNVHSNFSFTVKKKERPELQDLDPIRIVQWSGGRADGVMKGCDIPCIHTVDKSEASLQKAAAVVFSIPSYGGEPKAALRGKHTKALTVALSMESSEYYRRQKDLSDYDLTITCSFDSDLPVTYYGWGYDLLLNVSDWPWERREPAIVFIAKNCHSRNRRETLVRLLQKYVRVDSVSSCMNNHPWPADIPRTNKDDLQKRYLMYLAAENSVEKDYVTEKVYGGLINGAVPLYLGSPNIQEFVPTHSVIEVPADFTEVDVQRISETVKQIFTNKTVYEEWIEFKKHPYEERFKRKFSISRTHIWCRLCRKIFAMQNGHGWDKELQEIIFAD